jgi:hypothetical protein
VFRSTYFEYECRRSENEERSSHRRSIVAKCWMCNDARRMATARSYSAGFCTAQVSLRPASTSVLLRIWKCVPSVGSTDGCRATVTATLQYVHGSTWLESYRRSEYLNREVSSRTRAEAKVPTADHLVVSTAVLGCGRDDRLPAVTVMDPRAIREGPHAALPRSAPTAHIDDAAEIGQPILDNRSVAKGLRRDEHTTGSFDFCPLCQIEDCPKSLPVAWR